MANSARLVNYCNSGTVSGPYFSGDWSVYSVILFSALLDALDFWLAAPRLYRIFRSASGFYVSGKGETITA